MLHCMALRESELASLVAETLRVLRPGGRLVVSTDYDEQPLDTAGTQAYGVVAILDNGPGPRLAIRADLDALPVTEDTGLPYASHVRAKNAAGQDVGVMHACGHDVHVTTMIGTARALAATRSKWHGTLMLIGQPAEETANGSVAMLADRVVALRRDPALWRAMSTRARDLVRQRYQWNTTAAKYLDAFEQALVQQPARPWPVLRPALMPRDRSVGWAVERIGSALGAW